MPTKTDIFLDTNVLLYALDKGSPYHTSASSLLKNPNLNFFVTTKVISEYFAVCSKLGVLLSDAFVLYRSVSQNAKILFPGNSSLAIFEQLLQKYQPKGNRVFDLEIVSVAVANQIPEIATVNLKDFSGITEITVRPL